MLTHDNEKEKILKELNEKKASLKTISEKKTTIFESLYHLKGKKTEGPREISIDNEDLKAVVDYLKKKSDQDNKNSKKAKQRIVLKFDSESGPQHINIKYNLMDESFIVEIFKNLPLIKKYIEIEKNKASNPEIEESLNELAKLQDRQDKLLSENNKMKESIEKYILELQLNLIKFETNKKKELKDKKLKLNNQAVCARKENEEEIDLQSKEKIQKAEKKVQRQNVKEIKKNIDEKLFKILASIVNNFLQEMLKKKKNSISDYFLSFIAWDIKNSLPELLMLNLIKRNIDNHKAKIYIDILNHGDFPEWCKEIYDYSINSEQELIPLTFDLSGSSNKMDSSEVYRDYAVAIVQLVLNKETYYDLVKCKSFSEQQKNSLSEKFVTFFATLKENKAFFGKPILIKFLNGKKHCLKKVIFKKEFLLKEKLVYNIIEKYNKSQVSNALSCTTTTAVELKTNECKTKT